MNAMTSAWDTGTYDLLVMKDPQGKDGDLMLVVFARPLDPEDEAATADAPILAEVDVPNEDYDWTVQDYHLGMRTVGERGLLTPENIPGIYGDMLGLQVLLALYEGAERDSRGIDMDDMPWRPPASEAIPIMSRTYNMMLAIKDKLGME
jgi:hypothetical protein